MAFELTQRATLASQEAVLEPQIVLEIDGVDTLYGVRIISKKVRFDDGLKFDGSWKFNGLVRIEDQQSLISYQDGTTTQITQQLYPDKGASSSITSMQVALIDKNGMITELVSPGQVVEDILGRRARVYLGFKNVSFPHDYIVLFRGVIDDIDSGPGVITLNIAHPDLKKRQNLFSRSKVTMITGIDDNDTAFYVSGMDQVSFNPEYPDTNGLRTYFKFGDEFMEVGNSGGAIFATRGQLGTTPAAVAVGDEGEVWYLLTGNVIDLALRLMLSDKDQSPYVENVPITNFEFVDIDTTVENGIFFQGLDLVTKYGVTVGDIIKISGAANGANNSSTLYTTVSEIITRVDGTILVVEDAEHGNFVDERDSDAVALFISQFNNLGNGLGMKPDEVDIDEHLRIKQLYLSSFDVEVMLADGENIKEFIEQELYLPASAYSLPRKAKASLGLHIGPIPGTQTKIITANDVKFPGKLKLRRSISNNFYNTIIYKFDQDYFSGEFRSGIVTISEDSKNRIQVGTKALEIKSRGLRSSLNGENLATVAGNRRLDRFQFGAEYIEGLRLKFGSGFNIEPGDLVLLDGKDLGLLESKSASRTMAPRFFEVFNKTMDYRSGDITLKLVDTQFSTANRYGLISPSSRIKKGISTTKFVIEQAFESVYGTAEYLKWTKFLQNGGTVAVKIRSPNFTDRFFETVIEAGGIVGNEVTVRDALGFTPQPGDFMEFADYDFEGTTPTQKALYGYMKDAAFDDGGAQYKML